AVEAGDDLWPGQSLLPMHWGSASLGGEGAAGINALTSPARRGQSQQPDLNHCAVRISKAELPWRLCAFGFVDGIAALEIRASLRPLLDAFPFASVTLIGREHAGVLFRAASPAAVAST